MESSDPEELVALVCDSRCAGVFRDLVLARLRERQLSESYMKRVIFVTPDQAERGANAGRSHLVVWDHYAMETLYSRMDMKVSALTEQLEKRSSDLDDAEKRIEVLRQRVDELEGEGE